MEPSTNFDFLNLLAQLATLVSLIVGIFTVYLGFRIYRRQMNAQIFMTYAERYERIMESFPDFHVRFDFDNPPPESDQLRLCILKYLNLSSEEFYLWKSKYIANDVWRIWEHELKRMLRSKLVLREWQQLKSEFESYPAFVGFVEKTQSEEIRSDVTEG